ncbi:MAG: hypothetical protein RIF41_03470 [Polyangiaceae bacterium]
MHPPKFLALLLSSLLLTAACSGDDPSSGTGGNTGVGGSDGECATGMSEQPVGPCLVAQYAGSYDVTPTSGTPQRGTMVIGADGAVDYDTGFDFPITDYEGVFDRLDCCMRISVEMTQRPDNDTSLAPDARHRVDIFTDQNVVGGVVTRFEYFPNWPSEDGKVELDVVP